MTDRPSDYWPNMSNPPDVLVVGAGIAGPVAARGLARRGRRVLLVDQAPRGRWKVCGCCLAPLAQRVLGEIGLGRLPAQLGAVPLRRLRLAAGRSSAEVPLVGWQALSRTRLDPALIAEAEQAGVTFLADTHAVGLPGNRVELRRPAGERCRPAVPLVLAADGLGGSFARSLVGDSLVADRSRIGIGATVTTAPAFYQTGTVYMAYGSAGYLGLVRLEDGSLDMAGAFRLPTLDQTPFHPAHAAEQLLQEVGWPSFPELLAARWRGTPKLTRTARTVAVSGVWLVGDATGYVEPFTGEGISWALSDAADIVPLADAALRSGDTSPYLRRRTHARKARSRQRICRAIAWLGARPTLARAVIGLLHYCPAPARLVVPGVGHR